MPLLGIGIWVLCLVCWPMGQVHGGNTAVVSLSTSWINGLLPCLYSMLKLP